MKSKLFLAASLLFAASLLQSCATHKSALALRKSHEKAAKEGDKNCFVQWNDGSFDVFGKLELVTGPFTSPYLLADGQRKIEASQIKAYQNKEHYAISQQLIQKGRKTFVADGTLPGFAIRIAHGKFNLYAKKFHNGQHSVDEFFLQEGDKGHIFSCTNEVMTELLEKDPESFDFIYARMSTTSRSKKMQQLASLAKSNQSLTKAR